MASSKISDGKAEQELSRAEQVLKQTDFVMEPGAWNACVKYLASGGQPQTVVELLSDGYVGYAQMVSLVCKWLHLVQTEAEVDEEGASGAPDEFYFLRQLAKERFHPDKVANVFTGGRPPAWLDGLVANKRGRQLLYELSAQHRNSLLLNFAIQKILRQGHEDEVAAVGSTLANYFGVFHRLLAARLRTAATSNREAQLQQICQEIQESCQSQHTYMHVQHVLTELGRCPGGGVFRRLSQELEAHLARQHPQVRRMNHIFLGPLASKQEVEATMLVGEVLAICADAVDLPPVDPTSTVITTSSAAGIVRVAPQLSELCRLYGPLTQASNSPEGTLPPLGPIHHPSFIQLLIDSVFNMNSQSHPEVWESCLILLATSIAGSGVQREGSEGGFSFEAFTHAKESLQDVVPLLAKTGHGERLTEDEAGRMTKVAEVISSTLRAMGNACLEVATAFVDAMVKLLLLGCVEPVLGFVESWSKGAEHSLVRHFVFQLLQSCAPPYSPTFASALIRLMLTSGVRRSRGSGQTVPQLLEEFSQSCHNITFSPPLKAKEIAFLQELRQVRG